MKNNADNGHSSHKLDARSKWTYSAGGIGRDMTYTFIDLFLIIYIQYTMNLTAAQFSTLAGILVVYRIWDAINDPIMGTIIENTKTRWGKFKPWILFGAITNAAVIVALFTIRPEGWGFVIFFAIAYLIWDLTFTMNDIAYWSMLPALSRDQKSRIQLTSLVTIFASVGAFTAGGLVPFFTTGNAVEAYRMFAIIFSICFVICQIMTVFGVRKEHDVIEEKEKSNVGLKEMVKIVIHNKQLMWMSLVILLYYLGSALLNALGINFFYFEFGYTGLNMTIFTVVYALGTILAQIAYPLVAKHVARDKIVKYSFFAIAIGYILFTLVGFVPFLPMNIWLISAIGILIFAGQGLFYIATLIMLTNTIEYGEYLTNERNESILFSLRPFMAKMSSAIQQGIVVIILMASGLYGLSQKISQLEGDLGKKLITQDQLLEQVPNIVSQATTPMKFILRIGMAIIPLILITGAYYIIKKKYIIDEKTYDEMVKEIERRRSLNQ
jgi:melibiose permease/lactose/raffinose/galactose permease